MPIPTIPEQFNAVTAFVDHQLAEGRGERVALRWGEESITYAELAANVNRAGQVLRRLGVRLEERVLLVLLDSPAFVYCFWGAIKIGAVPVPVNTFMRPDEYAYLLNDSRAGVVVVSPELWPAVQPAAAHSRWLRHRLIAGAAQAGALSLPELMQREEPVLEPEPTHRDDVALWLYSSGSTGTPKGVMHLHRDLLYCADTYARDILAITADDVTLAAPRLFFAYGLGGGMTFALRAGATAVLVSERPTPEGMFAAIHRYRPTLFFGVPTLYAAMLQVHDAAQKYDLSSLRLCVSAGEPLPAELFHRWRERFGVEILDGIGTTEALHIFLSNRAGQVRPGSSGTPVPGYEVRVVDEHGQEVPQGEIGDLLVKGGSITIGYWHKLEATRRALYGEWLRTGDKYYQDQEGVFWYCGRSDDMLKVSGQWVSPAEVEGLLFQHPAVLEAAVVGWEDENRLIKPKAFVVLRAGYTPSPALAEELQQFVKARTLPHKYPRWIEFVAELPKTATGKIQRYKLRAPAGREQ
ncbi:MAG: benzoate-CoA ligase family protein [Candidatus Binatia bacterium]|nr:benzoate-CoA ligase family protein [Candidatus Binatia bacterium]